MAYNYSTTTRIPGHNLLLNPFRDRTPHFTGTITQQSAKHIVLVYLYFYSTYYSHTTGQFVNSFGKMGSASTWIVEAQV